jgi:preprotein translocase subunit SecA
MSFDKFLTRLFGSSNQRFLKSINPLVHEINSLEPSMQALSDAELRARTATFKERVARAVGDTTDKE